MHPTPTLLSRLPAGQLNAPHFFRNTAVRIAKRKSRLVFSVPHQGRMGAGAGENGSGAGGEIEPDGDGGALHGQRVLIRLVFQRFLNNRLVSSLVFQCPITKH